MFFYVFHSNKSKSDGSKTDRKKSNRTKLIILSFLVILAVTGAVLVAFKLCYVPCSAYCDAVGEYSLVADSQEMRISFFEQFGYTAYEADSYEAVVPYSGEAFEEYNNIQLSHGLDLAPYAGLKVKGYGMKLNGGGNELYGNILVYKGRVIAVHFSDCLYPGEVSGLDFGGGGCFGIS